MKKFILILLGFILGMIFTAIMAMYSVQITKIESNGKVIDNAGVTITLFGNDFNYYYE